MEGQCWEWLLDVDTKPLTLRFAMVAFERPE